MDKKALVQAVSDQVDLTRDKATKTINVILQEITQALSKGDRVLFVGFGTFTVVKRSARKGKNPRTGTEIQIPAKSVPKFKVGKILKNAILKNTIKLKK